MDENTTIWDKKMSDLTVKDNVLLTAALPIVAIAGMAAAGAVAGAVGSLVTKFRSRKNDQTDTTN